ncbi:metal transporter Nramp7.2-like [Gastrolobium bilobum]|uniref:metal transporter Nramp7.2-like n=1 Tax=Gastrolobium bilobum TaxID=150636 RepID=UPI002AB17B8C|nr:metal transporter Nramp7.2-like [Gastrolobium bilobum]
MASLIQQESDATISSRIGGSNRIVAFNVTPPNNSSPPSDSDGSSNIEKPGWKKFLSHVGPGFLVSMAYIDGGSLETDLQAGANYGYEMLWLVLLGMIFALVIQSLAANLGVTTGKHLAEICKAEYPLFVKYCLWLLAELAVIAADIPDVLATAIAFNLLFNAIPLWLGVLLTGGSTLLFLALQRYGIRKLELVIAISILLLAACFFAEMSYAKVSTSGVLKGMFVPKLSGNGATGNAIALFGALIMPHNLFLHSGLVLSRKVPHSANGVKEARTYFLIESGFALFVAFLIQVAMVSVPAAVCSGSNLSAEDGDNCNNITLKSASFLLKSVLGRSSKTIYAIALLASGLSSTITGTCAGQYIMQGFFDLKMKGWIQNMVTRGIAIIPSLVVSIVGGPSGSGQLIIIASMVLSFELPFALIPLLKFSNSSAKMGTQKNSKIVIIISWILSVGIFGINMYFLGTAFVGWLIHSSLPKVANVFIGIIVFPLMAIYVISIIYLTFRKDTVKTFKERENEIAMQDHVESGVQNIGQLELNQAPYREDLADIPFPEYGT